MNKLIELKEWQQKQEEILRQTQQKQLLLLNEQKNKFNFLTNKQNAINWDSKQTIDTKSDGLLLNSDHNNDNKESVEQNINESIEEIRAEENCFETQVNNNSIEIQNSSENKPNFVSHSESSPIVPGIDGKKVKTFEDLLNIRLRLDDNRVKNNSKLDSINVQKKPFLRKGEGIKRFDGINKSINKKTCLQNNDKKVCSETQNSVKENLSQKPKPRTDFNKKKIIDNKLSTNKTQKSEISLKTENKTPKKFNRKVIPLTTKTIPNKSKNREIIVSRNTSTLNNQITEDESALFDYLEYICGNISLDSNSSLVREQPIIQRNTSLGDKLNDKDINELQKLLEKIELKKNVIKSKLDENNCWTDISDDENKSQNSKNKKKVNKAKKKVRWSHNTSGNSFERSEYRDEEDNDLNEPKFGAYSSSLKQQIIQLENRMSQLKSQTKKERVANDCVLKPNTNAKDISNPVNNEVIKLKEQIERLNNRLMNIESKSYDLISPQIKEIRNCKKKVVSNPNYIERNPMKTITSPNGLNISVNQNQNDTTVDFPNGDKMKISNDNTMFYTFKNGVTQTTYPDGLKIINFPNGQIEKLHKNGVKHITYTNGLQRIINPDSSEEVLMQDGTIWRVHSDGSESLEFLNGDREIRTNNYKRREYSNGNIKTIYSDGTQETRYINGRLRIKDKFGNLIVDSLMRHLNEHISHN